METKALKGGDIIFNGRIYRKILSKGVDESEKEIPYEEGDIIRTTDGYPTIKMLETGSRPCILSFHYGWLEEHEYKVIK